MAPRGVLFGLSEGRTHYQLDREIEKCGSTMRSAAINLGMP